MIVGDYAFDLNDENSQYNHENYSKAVQAAHDEIEIYYRAGNQWYNLAEIKEDQGLVDEAKVEATEINGGIYKYWNMEK